MLHSHFSAHVTDYTRYFTGRGWVFHKLNTWLDADQPQVFLLTGEPGSGKSTLASRLVQMSNGEALANDYPHLAQGCLTFAHFCQARSDITLNPLRFVEFLSQQLAHRYQAFALAILQFKDQNITVNATQTVGTAESGSTVANVVINSLSIGNLSARFAFDRLVRRPLEQLYTTNFNETICILVDALDEALTYDPDDNVVTLLGYATDLPRQVRFLLTSRSDPRVLRVIGESCLDLIDDAPDNADDVRAYALKRLQTLAEPRRGEVANLVTTAGRGNFLYARYVLDDFLSGIDEGKEPSDLTLPEGLPGIYRQFLKRELGTNLDRWGQRYRPLLGVLAVARSQGLTRAQLAGVTGRSPSETGDLLRTCAQYLDGPLPEGPFRLYHESFRDFLLSDETYQADAIEANQAIADFFCKVYEGDWLNCTEDYALQYTPTHLQEAIRQMNQPIQRLAREKELSDLTSLLTNLGFMEAKVGRLGVDALLADLRAALSVAMPTSEFQTNLASLLHVMNREAHNLRGWVREQYPAFFAQQMRNRAVEMGLRSLIDVTEGRLVQLGQRYFSLVWRAARESAELERTLVGHAEAVNAVAVTPDGQSIVSGSDDHTLRIWNLLTGHEERTLVGHAEAVNAVAITPDGQSIVSGSDDYTLKVWDLRGGHEERTLVGHAEAVNAVAITPDGQNIVSGSDDYTLKVWDLRSGQIVYTLECPDAVNALAITHDGRRVISASNTGTLKVWDLIIGQEIIAFANTDKISFAALTITSDDRHLISASSGGLLNVWDLQTGQEVQSLNEFRPMEGVVVTPDDRYIIAATAVRSLHVWDLHTGEQVHILAGHAAAVNAVVITPDGRYVISASADLTLKVWNIPIGKETRPLAGHWSRVNAVAVIPDGSRAISASDDGELKIWDIQTGEEIGTLENSYLASGWAMSVAINPNGRYALAGYALAMIIEWNLQSGEGEALPQVHGDGVRGLAIDPKGVFFVSASSDNTVKFWNDEQTGLTIIEHEDPVNAVVITPDRHYVISASEDHILQVCDLWTAQVVHTLVGHSENVGAVTSTPDGRYVVSGSDDCTLKVWEHQTGQEVRTISGHAGWVTGVTVTPDSRYVISASEDRTVRVWELQTGHEVARVALDSVLWCITRAPDGVTILVGDLVGSLYCLRNVDPRGSTAPRN